MTKKKSKQQQKEQKLFAASTIGRPAEVCKRCGKVVESSLVGEIAKFFCGFFLLTDNDETQTIIDERKADVSTLSHPTAHSKRNP